VADSAIVFEDAAAAAAWRETQRARGRRVVFTNGCFDLLHAGHVAYLAWARGQGDVLLLGLNADDSVRRLKGPQRPLVPFAERAAILAGLRSVDAIVGFSEATPEVLLDVVRPDVHVKSDQYRVEDLPERIVVERWGGEIRLAPHEQGRSTTDLVARIRSRFP
jgi:D-beta-D-heptose 7-phosphate kinase/D-beta-D-heptose 1-phosphate adenosyltransferase